MNIKQIVMWAVIVTAVTGAAVMIWSRNSGHPSERINYPYVCRDCGAVFDYKELKADDYRNWKVPKGAPSDSVAVCLRCGKGWAFPVGTCEECKTQHILYLTRDSRCPRCFPEAEAAAKKAGVDVYYHPK